MGYDYLGQTATTDVLFTVANYIDTPVSIVAAIEHPTPGQVVSGIISISGYATAQVDAAQMLVDLHPITPIALGQGARPLTLVPPPPYVSTFRASLDTRLLAPGSHTIKVILTVRPFIVQVPTSGGGGGILPTDPLIGPTLLGRISKQFIVDHRRARTSGRFIAAHRQGRTSARFLAALRRARHRGLGAYRLGPPQVIEKTFSVAMTSASSTPGVVGPVSGRGASTTTNQNAWLWLLLGAGAVWYLGKK